MSALYHRPPFRPKRAALLLALVVIAGCGKSYEVAQVDGTLTIKGKPGNKILIQFLPSGDQASKGPMSMAETDAQGHFVLELKEGTKSRPGAVVGTHRVVLSDMQLAASDTGRGVPIRLTTDLTLPGSTPLTQEVKSGKQTIEIKIP